MLSTRSILARRGLSARSMLLRSPATTVGAARPMSSGSSDKLVAPPMVYISGEEMTTYCMELIMEKWIEPHIDTSKWEFYNLSCKTRDDTEDQVLHDAVAAGARIKAIFKDPTVTPTEVRP
eukprot:SAG11_NODE_17488_length_517_cov_0.877990_1_plen_120_part_01